MNLCTSLYILIIIIKIKSLSAFYNIPTFIQQNNLSVPITSNGYDPCRFFQIRNQTLYRMGQSNIISSWNLSTLAYTQQLLYQTLDWSIRVSNIAIGFRSNQMITTLITPVSTKLFNFLDPLTLQFLSSSYFGTLTTYTAIKMIPTQTQYLQLLYSNSLNNYLLVYNKNMVLIQQMILPISGLMNASICEDESGLLIWTSQGVALFVQSNGTSWTYYSYSAPITSNFPMNSISISKNGTVALLQRDSQSPFLVINFKTISIYSKMNFTNTIINQAIFLDEDCHLIALTVNYTTLQIYDTLTLTLQSTTVFGAVSNYSVVDYASGTMYFCLQKNIQTFNIKCPRLAYRSTTTNQCLNCSVDINCYECDQDTGLCISCDTNFTLNSSLECQPIIFSLNTTNTTNSPNGSVNVTNQTNNNVTNSTNINSTNSTSTNSSNSNFNNLTNSTNNETNSTIVYPNQQVQANNMSPAQVFIFNATLEGFNAINPVITTIFSIIQMSPFALIFLSFMNYWNLCCLYSILNVKVPEYLPQIHQKIFQAIQSSIFIDLGFNPTLPSLDNASVPSTYYKIDYSIELDFINPNVQNVLMIFFVLLLILTTICLRNFFLKKSSFLYKFLKINIVQSLIGQFISFVPFCILSYRFLINETGFINLSTKLNLNLQVFLLILCFLSPCIFIWSRSQRYIENKIIKNKSFQEKFQDQIKSKILIQKIKYHDQIRQNQNLKELQMFIVNITLPILIILPIYLPFFIINLGIFLYGIKKASKCKQYRINSIITACYLPIYHTCYIIFYLFGQNEFVYNYVGLFCLIVLVLGGFHELCNVLLITLYEFIKWLIKTFKQQCISSKVSNQPLKKTQINNTKLSSLHFQSSIINSESIGKIANSYNQKQESKIKKSFKSKNVIKINQQKVERIKADVTKNRVKAIKFKIQKTYQRGLEINQTMKPLVKQSFQKQKDDQFETSERLQNFENTQKEQENANNKIQNNLQQQIEKKSNYRFDKFNQMLRKDRILRKMRSGKNLPNYKIL